MKLKWDETGSHVYETGIDMGVLYLLSGETYQTGVAWNGLTGVTESPSGAENTALYADNIKYLNLMSNEEFGATIEAYTYPKKFEKCLGEIGIGPGVIFGQQPRSHFGFCYRTKLGDDINGIDRGYKIHIVFDCLAKPSEKGYSTINDSPEAITFSWEITTNQVIATGYKPTSVLTLESKKFKDGGMWNALKYIEGMLFGTDETEAKLPFISEILEAISFQIHLIDSGNDELLDSSGNPIQSSVFD